MSTPSDPALRLPLVALFVASSVLGACSSSSGGGDDPVDDAPGGPITTPDGGGGTVIDGGPADPDGGSDGMPTDGTEGGSSEMPGGESEPVDGGGTTTVITNGVFGSISGRTTRFGTVQIDQPSNGDEGSASAGFFRTTLPLPVDQAIASFVPPLDTCTVTRIESGDVGLPDAGDPDFDFDFESLSAGETITFTSPAGTWLTLPRQEAFGFVAYGSEDGLPQPVPSGLTLDIPGDAFPAFANVRVPDVVPLRGAMPVDAVTPDTTFRWESGGGDPSVYVRIDVVSGGLGFLPGGLPPEVLDSLPEDFPGLGDGSLTTLDCVVRDDGEFALPSATRAELGADFSGSATFTRLGTTAVQRGDTLLLVFNESSVN